jgi:hypothetical protein
MSVTALEHWVQQLKGAGQLDTTHSSKSAFDLGQSGVQTEPNSGGMPCHIMRRHGRTHGRGQEMGS